MSTRGTTAKQFDEWLAARRLHDSAATPEPNPHKREHAESGSDRGADTVSKLDEMMKDCDAYERDAVHRDSAFSEMVKKLQHREGYSKEVATKTAAKIGREKYGAEGMAKRAAASRRAHGR